jgi:hypothetical protein
MTEERPLDVSMIGRSCTRTGLSWVEAMREDGAVTRTEFGRSQSGSPSFGSCGCRSSPRLERFFSEDAVRVAGGEMALDVEGVLDGGVNGQEALG